MTHIVGETPHPDYSAQKEAIYTRYAQGEITLDDACDQILAIGPKPDQSRINAVRFVLVCLFGLIAVAMLAGCTVLRCDQGATCDGNTSIFSGPSASPTPSPSPSPSASPSVSPTPDPCKADAIVASLSGGSQLEEIAVTDAPKRLDATAFNSQGEIPTGCNLTRFPVWEVLKIKDDKGNIIPATCAILGSGWNPHLDGIKVGACEVRACLRQSGDGACFADRLAGESSPVTSPVLSVVVR